MLASRPFPRLLGGALRRRWWLLPAAAAVAVGVAAGLTAAQTPLYEATATLVVAPSTEVEEPDDVLRSLETLERRTVVATLAKIPAAPETLRAAAAQLGLAPAALAPYRLRAAVQPYTNAIAVTALGPDPQRAADLANAVAAVSRPATREFARIFTLRPLAQALPPRQPISPDPARSLAVAAFLGLVIGAAAAWLAEARAGRA